MPLISFTKAQILYSQYFFLCHFSSQRSSTFFTLHTALKQTYPTKHKSQIPSFLALPRKAFSVQLLHSQCICIHSAAEEDGNNSNWCKKTNLEQNDLSPKDSSF
jgi:hypothetical protein